MTWIKTSDQLPPEKKYVLARHNRTTWVDEDQNNVNCVVVKLIRGISERQRNRLRKIKAHRANIHLPQDESPNNPLPYFWDTFGPGSFFGHEITHWMPIPPI